MRLLDHIAFKTDHLSHLLSADLLPKRPECSSNLCHYVALIYTEQKDCSRLFA